VKSIRYDSQRQLDNEENVEGLDSVNKWNMLVGENVFKLKNMLKDAQTKKDNASYRFFL